MDITVNKDDNLSTLQICSKIIKLIKNSDKSDVLMTILEQLDQLGNEKVAE